MSYIVPRDKPQECSKCPYINQYNDCRLILGSERIRTVEEQYQHCPLIEVPTPHGKLIDKDKLMRKLFVNFNGERIPFYDCDNFPTKIAYRDLYSILAEQKTVIEAED